MSLSSRPLSYCTNVHPGRSQQEVLDGLSRYTVPVRDRLDCVLAAGLWLAQPVVEELLATDGEVDRFAEELSRRKLTCHTLNAFPYGDFHKQRVKEQVYIPDWSQPERLNYTRNCATVLAKLLPEQAEGSLSTVPLGWKEFGYGEDFLEGCIGQLIEMARFLERLEEKTGKTIRLAIEPEPLCVLETTAEFVSFFARLRQRAAEQAAEAAVENFIGMCYDVCHQAVEYEDIASSIRQIAEAGIRINKLHITCAIELDHPAENQDGRQALSRYVEGRYLHQTTALNSSGEVFRITDLSEELIDKPEAAFREAASWRIHFHVPVHAEHLGPLKTTRPELIRAVGAISQLDYSPHLEVETYTWNVMPGAEPVDLVDGLTRELQATQRLLAEMR